MTDPAPFRPSPGDRLRRQTYSKGRHVVVTAVGKESFLGNMINVFPGGTSAYAEDFFELDGGWLPALPPHVFPERYIPLRKNGILAAGNFDTAEAAVRSTDINFNDKPTSDPYRTALLLHILPDGTTRWEDPPDTPEPGVRPGDPDYYRQQLIRESTPDDGIRTRGGDKWDVSAADVPPIPPCIPGDDRHPAFPPVGDIKPHFDVTSDEPEARQ